MPIGNYSKKEPPKPVPPEAITKSSSASINWTLTSPRYKMQDIILDPITKSHLEDAISYFQNKDLLFNQWGLKERFSDNQGLSINLYGPPGTGKTMAAHAIAQQLNLPLICVDYAEIESKYVGETSKNLSSLFKCATECNCIIFFDEADALLSKRVTNMTSSTDVSVNQTRSVLLNLLNYHNGVIIFSTNFIQNFDPAFIRRIKYHIQFQLPNLEGRKRLWKQYLPSQMPNNLDIQEISRKYDGVSGSDISNAIFSAAVSAARNHETFVHAKRFEDAIEALIAVKKANLKDTYTISTRHISEQEALEHLKQET